MKTRAWFFALLLIFAQRCVGQAPATIPAAEQQTKGWLEAFNSGKSAMLLAFLQKYGPEEAAHVDGLLDFQSRTGGFEFEKTEDSTPTH